MMLFGSQTAGQKYLGELGRNYFMIRKINLALKQKRTSKHSRGNKEYLLWKPENMIQKNR